MVGMNGTFMNILDECSIYVNHRGHDRGKKNTGVGESDGGGRVGCGGDHSLSLSLSLSPVFFLPLSWPLWFTYMLYSSSIFIYVPFISTIHWSCSQRSRKLLSCFLS